VASVLIVGSGASGVHFALSALRRGQQVTMLDVGFEAPPAIAPNATVGELKEQLDDPVEYFLGPAADTVVYPGPVAKHYAFPPSKRHVFRPAPPSALIARGVHPYVSFARGGLAEAWTGGCYEYNDDDLRDFPFSSADLRPYYAEIVRRIGVSGARDDIERFSPFTAPYLDPLPLDAHSARLLDRYERDRQRLNETMGFYLGRSRVATLSRDHAGRGACTGLGRCLWGCPRDALWSPSMTLRECAGFERFTYVPGHHVRHFTYDSRGRVTAVVAESLAGGRREFHGDWIVLAAGTIGTTGIYLSSLLEQERREDALGGFMDNPHAVVPFVNMGHLGAGVDTATYQFHLLALALEGPDGRHDAHGQITTLRAASVHPIVQNLPFDLRTSLSVFRRIRSALGVANIWPAAARRLGNTISVRPDGERGHTVVLECEPDPGDAPRMAELVRRVRAALRSLDCVAPAGQSMVLPMGSSGRYVGTLPMSDVAAAHTCDSYGRVRGFTNLVIADGASFPGLPAKNHTFTLMANAARISDGVLDG
jgi:choline dehydrogenase-like flavoprotein